MANFQKETTHRYINRDLSWIEFNRRVLEEAQDSSTPLLERVKFLSIVSTNLDEFMSVRVAGLMDQIRAGYTRRDFTGYAPQSLLRRIMKRASRMVSDQYRTYRDLLRCLAREGLVFTAYDDLNPTQQNAMDQYYHDLVFPVLTPMAVDQSRPFPLVHSLNMYLAVVLRPQSDGGERAPAGAEAVPEDEDLLFAILQVPSNLPRFLPVPARGNSKKREFVLLEDLISHHIGTLFSGYEPLSVEPFRLTRNADLSLNEEGAEDLLEEIEKELRRRRWGAPVRLEIGRDVHPYALQMLQEEFELDEANVFSIDGPLDLSYFMKFAASVQGYEHLRFPRLEPVYPKELDFEDRDMFSILREKDVLVYHPYESFDAVNDLIVEAASDPRVLAIKMTMYRVSGDSLIVRSLARAAEAGKQVTVVVELKARFDEERNIAWARQLEKAGCHVVYGLVGLKTHAKIILVVRQEQDGLRRYVHVGTGNYNDNTAKLYTDVGLFTADPVIGEDASMLFNEVTGYAEPQNLKRFSVAPTNLKSRLFALIDREAENARSGRPARIVAKMNSLSNQEMVDKLYEASQAGVRIDLIVRGVCCLRPGVPGLSENITVRSIVDRFLEHSRLFYFANGGRPEVYLSSADWMTRNLTRRIELMCPISDPELRTIATQILNVSLRDNVKARELKANGQYTRVEIGDQEPFRSQFAAQDISTWKKLPAEVVPAER
ncbi:polyphosphate kinase 1 [Paenibacillus thermoaerophilus]|uniref:Polyphosphate kinase n=1 Tax=Paenibacillus thermoaerophilus TaxID=1215385 RepID=A0ABW2V2T7_9BACL|nr:polyphosphate kinase 1 [Paenibacillus thermoaerophilus]TMV16007.1 polyphosphate kinase 1 [Paenibacillus thermoaerophilus]